MIKTLLRAAGLTLAVLVVTGVLWMPATWSPLWALLLPGVFIATLALVLAGEFALLGFSRAAAAEGPPAASVLVAAWWQELWATARLALWRMPFPADAADRRLKSQSPAPRGLVLVHGYACNHGIWNAWQTQLAALQVSCVAVDLEPLFASIADYSPIIEAAVDKLQRQTGRAPVLVAHSMGGLAARIWWAQDPSARRLHRLITVGSPHQGTWLATFGWGANARQMRPQSTWLARLRSRESRLHAQRTLCFYSDCDNLVVPGVAATLPGADNRRVTGAGHVAMVDHPAIFAAALQALRASD